jgi:hypothetical protein
LISASVTWRPRNAVVDLHEIRFRQLPDHLFGEHLAEDMMLGRRMPRVERYHGERRSQRLQREACLDHRARAGWTDAVCPPWLLNMREVTIAEVRDVGIEDRRDLIAHPHRDHDLVRTGEARQPGP